MLQVWRFLCVWFRFLILLRMFLDFFKLPLAHLQNFSFLAHWPGRKGRSPLLFLGNWKEWACLLQKMAKLRVFVGKFLIKNTVLGVPRWKKRPIFPHKAFCLIVVAEIFLKVALYLETYSVLKTPGCMPGRPPWLADKRNVWVLDQLEDSLLQWFNTLRFLYFKAYFSFTWHLKSPYTGLLQFKHKFTYLFTINLKIKPYIRQEQSLKNMVINSKVCRSLEPPSSKDNPLYDQGPF